ncbi:MAG: glycerophosphodiester phosphodiesterase [Actinomycetota bacterium]|nr:glycerophosphodiester phosphodiesterase [Actinomycetota bacterium]
MRLRRGEGRPLVIGHRGAAAVAPENTLASLEAAVAAGADLVEFDISPGLRLGHSELEIPTDPIDLDFALEYLREHRLGVHLDVKLPGYETEVVAALRRHGLEERAVVSTAFAVTSRRVAVLAPQLPRAIGYPRDRLGVARIPWPRGLTQAGAAVLRQAMPLRVPLLLRVARANVLSLHHALCSRAAVAAAHRLGAPVLAWTANDAETVRRLAAVGVDAIVSDDPGMALRSLATLLDQ